ncbi:hypothetical protein CVT24_008868 [Panaeolus cyanescens]|uniref:branched-chain-amino-acid transaminase n=1 Tax=Panaeolus cyanescens TaxID=181874 RepID=A0A409VDL2_9AGAR|nr:hypothetical protein CVT24_008868 [Panaeolus cyanescens]
MNLTSKASKLVVNLAKELKELPPPESLAFGQTKTDHMLVVNYHPVHGWSAPEIKPYAPLEIDPMASCLQYATTIFEGMKAYVGPNGEARLFRPDLNMARLARSAERVALPPFDQNELLKLIKRLIQVESRWIPTLPGYSLYIRPTIIGTRDALGVAASDASCIYVIVSPTGPYFKNGGHKLGVNYAPGFLPQRHALKQGYEQILWLLGKEEKVTEILTLLITLCASSNRSEIKLITPPLDGTILPGLTRASTLALARAHSQKTITLPGLSSSLNIVVEERPLTMAEIAAYSASNALLEAFGVGTAVIVAPVSKIGWKGKDLVLPAHEGGLGPIGQAMWKMITDIQTGKIEFEGWSVVCE